MGLSVLAGVQEFLAKHAEKLNQAEARHNLMLGLCNFMQTRPLSGARFFHFGAPGACAIHIPEKNIILGELTKKECEELAIIFKLEGWDFFGVVGPESTADFFSAAYGGLHLGANQRIYQLVGEPRSPEVGGLARLGTAEDLELLTDWHMAYAAEAISYDKMRLREKIREGITPADCMLWICDEKTVAFARIARHTRHGACIGPVYVPPKFRGHKFGEAATAALAAHLRKWGKNFSCLYTDLANPASNKIYIRIGFEPVCDAKHWYKENR